MAIKVTKRATNDGARYSISGLTFSQLFRIKNAMAEEEKRMNKIADDFARNNRPGWEKEFRGYAKNAHDVFIAVNDGCF